MKKLVSLVLVILAFIALPAFAQEQETKPETMSMTPPQPLADDLLKWMVGEWQGTTTMASGKSQDWQKVELGLDNQFVITNLTSKWTEINPEAMKMSKEDADKMKDMPYKGMGMMTLNPTTGEFVGHWFDNWRGTYTGTGKREGDKITATWQGAMGTRTETMEKVGADKMVITFSQKDPGGNVMEGRTEFTRTKGGAKS